MKKLFFMGLMLAVTAASTPLEAIFVESNDQCCPEYPPGPRGKKGSRGSKGERGHRGFTGDASPTFRINDILEVTSTFLGSIEPEEAIQFNPIVYPTTGINSGNVSGLALIEEVPSSGIFNTIFLPASPVETYYSVTYGFCNDIATFASFQLYLNGVALPYTEVTNGPSMTNTKLAERTSVVINPAGVSGTLSFRNTLGGSVVLTPVTPAGFSAYITIVKLNEAP